ncbi:MAG: ABC transporter substrate-binding protein [Synergistota bacterium]|nr:ABC transporter substrate-binding protein [Synergistota bacterium]
MNKLLKLGLSVVFVLSLLVGSVFAEDTIKIGLLAPLTGKGADDGINVKNSVVMAVEELNASGGLLGKKVELVYYDDRNEPKEAVGLAYKLIERDEVVGVVGGSYSFPTRAVAPIFQEEEIPFVAAYALHPDVTAAGDYCFRVGFLGELEGRGCAYLAVEKLGAKTVSLIHADNDFGRTLSTGTMEYLEKYAPDVKVLSDQAYPFGEKDYKAYLSKIKEENPDVVIASGYFFQAGPMLKQAREMGIAAQFVGEEGADSPETPKIAGDAAEGFIIATNLNRDDPRPFVQKYLKEYKERFEVDTCMVGASAYDAFMVLVNGIKTAGTTDGDKVKDAIAKSEVEGLTGTAKFTETGEVIKAPVAQIIKDGQFRFYCDMDDPRVVGE